MLYKRAPYILEIITENYSNDGFANKCYCVYCNTIKEAKKSLKKLNLCFDDIEEARIGKLFPIAKTKAYVRILTTSDGIKWEKCEPDIVMGEVSYQIEDLDNVEFDWEDYYDYRAAS